MAARTPRRSFATPFVITLAAAPACYVQSSPPPQQPPTATPTNPPGPDPTPAPVTNPGQPEPGNGPIITNPPMPQPQAQTVPPNTKWTVFKDADGCKASIVAACPPKTMCNPPPPSKYECPQGATLPVTVASNADGTACVIEYPMPKCPPNTACNPPRPTPVACPTR